jgi:glycosidase
MPKKEDAVIYQVNVRSFSDAGTLNGVKDKLADIQALGVNVIYLMPVYPVGQLNSSGELGSPYSVKDYKAIDPAFGNLDDLKALVDEAHSKNMAVILDWVANHTAWDNAWITDHPEWYEKDANGNIIIPPGTNWTDVAQLDYSNTELRKAMIDAMSYWVYNANIDGFRCDAADYVPLSFWSDAIPKLRAIKNQDILMLAEGTRVGNFAAGFDYTFGFNFFTAMEQVYSQSKPATTLQDANAAEYANNYNQSQRIVRYTNNHDVNLSDGTPLQLFHGATGSMAAFVVAAYMKSVPMIYNGQEIGYNQQIDFMNNVPINWAAGDQNLLAQYKSIIAFRNSSDALKRGTYSGYSSDAVSAFTMQKDNSKVFVMSNLTNATVNYILPAELASVSWTDAFSNTPVSVTEVTLSPYQYLVLKN